jgi:acetylornithine deacetylase/succinyl-diaminopimelate desuccinylase-like protein
MERRMADNDSQIDQFLEQGMDGFIAETIRLCKQPSVSARKEGTRECSKLVAQILERHGFAVQSFETAGDPVIVGHMDGKSERTLLLYNHYDVQPPEPLDLWTTPPFEPTLRDGALYARGADDDKGEFMARLAAVEAVRAAHGGELPCGITFVVEGQEEIGSPHIAQFVKEHLDLLKCQASIWEEGGIDQEGNPWTALGDRGILGVELAVDTMGRDAHSGNAHILPSAAWRLLRALACLKDSDEKILIPGFYDAIKPPSPGDLELFEAMPDRETWLRDTFGVTTFVGELTGKDLERAVFNPTCNIQGITTGYQGEGMKTVIPARATAKVDFRLLPDQDPDDIFKKLRAHLDAQGFEDVSVTWLGAMWPHKAEADDPFIQLTARTAEATYGRPYLIIPLNGGSSPTYAFAKPLGGIPIVTAGVNYGNNKAHAPDEHVRLIDFLNAARHIARIVDGFAGL